MTIQYWSIMLRHKLGWSALRSLLIDSSKQNFNYKSASKFSVGQELLKSSENQEEIPQLCYQVKSSKAKQGNSSQAVQGQSASLSRTETLPATEGEILASQTLLAKQIH